MADRDERVGAELRGLDVPDHGPEFFARLEQRLAQEPPAARPRRRPPMLLGGAAAAAILAVVGASVVFTGDGSTPPLRPSPSDTRLISAGEVRSRVSTALSSLRSLRGEVAIECAIPVGDCLPPDAGGRSTLRWSFVTTAAGDERVTGIGRQDDVAYSAARREQRVLTDVTNARAAAVSAGAQGPVAQAQAENALTGSLRSLFAVVENYPELRANQNVLELQEQLTTTENQISFSRQHYNASVLDYNTAIATFPSLLLAGPFGFTRREFFDAEPEAANVPTVDLSLS